MPDLTTLASRRPRGNCCRLTMPAFAAVILAAALISIVLCAGCSDFAGPSEDDETDDGDEN